MSYATTPEIEAGEAGRQAEDGSLLLDVREEGEFEAGHAPGARHLPLGRLAAEHTTLPRDRTIIAVCRSGGRSARATMALRGAGYDVVNLAGGMQAWAAAGLPVVTPAGQPGEVV
ncbi:MAG TPA: rhodanese-like domain-containing protein [Acidimicrobiales bacterium]|nr:rhodanese-like domain-containing protein [Acidimicrobiales bacterium]